MRTTRHNLVRDYTVAQLSVMPRGRVAVEAHCGSGGVPMPATREAPTRDGDVVVFNPNNNSWLYLDFVVTSHMDIVLRHAIQTGSAAAEYGYQRKMREHAQRVASRGNARLVPIAVGAFGHIHARSTEAIDLICNLADPYDRLIPAGGNELSRKKRLVCGISALCAGAIARAANEARALFGLPGHPDAGGVMSGVDLKALATAIVDHPFTFVNDGAVPSSGVPRNRGAAGVGNGKNARQTARVGATR